LDGLVHSIGFAPRDALAGDLLDGMSRENYRIAHDISAYSFPALAKAALPLMEGRNGSVLTMTYLGAEKAIPHYNMMGLAKASLGGNGTSEAMGTAAAFPLAALAAGITGENLHVDCGFSNTVPGME